MMRKSSIILLVFILSGFLIARDKDQFKVNQVEYFGNDSFDQSILNKVIVSSPSRFLSPTPFHKDNIEPDKDELEYFYHRRGFLDARVTDFEFEIDSVKKKASIKYYIEEGSRTRLDAVTYIGNELLSDSLLMVSSKLSDNSFLDADKIETAQKKLIRMYADRGYLEAKIDPVWSLTREPNHAILDFNIVEGDQYRIADVEISGLEKTNPGVVLRELSFSPGEIVSYSKILKSQRNLYLTGLFESVYVDPQMTEVEGDSAFQKITVRVKETQAGAFNVSLGYSSIERLRFKSEFLQNNLRGTGKKVGAVGRLSSLQRILELSFSNPRIYNSFWKMDMNLKYELQYQPTYDLKSSGGIIAIQRKLDKNLSSTLAFRNEINTLSNVKVDSLNGKDAANIHSLKLQFIQDTRNNLFNPERGHLYEWETEVAGGPVISSNSFVRSILKLRWFRPILGNSVIGTAIELGSVTSLAGNRTISIQERFYSGGPNSLRGYAYREIGPRDSKGYLQGGFYKIIWNVFELRTPLYKGFNLALFSDVGNVWWEASDVLGGDIAADVGIGLAYNTPLGVVRLDFGIPVGNVPAKSDVRLNFSMGYAF